MKRILGIMMALVLVVALGPIGIVSAQNNDNDTDMIYGITATGDIYRIDPIQGTETWIAEVDECPISSVGPNGLAYDQNTNRIYYTEYPDIDSRPPGDGPDGQTSLYFIDLDTGDETFAGFLEGEIACADIYEGHYYYIAGGESLGYTDDLYKVKLQPDGTVGSVDVYSNISGTRNSRWGFFGDIAIKDGVIYATGKCFERNQQEFFQVDVDGDNFQFIRDATAALQLAFGLDGQLYGHIFDDGRTWKVDWTDGSGPHGAPLVTYLFTATYRYTDLASAKTAAQPELYDICGYKYAEWEGELIPLPEWEIILEKWDDAEGEWIDVDRVETGPDGKYCFTDLEEGEYRLSEVFKEGWEQLYPVGNEHIVTLPLEAHVVYGVERDTGDLYEIDVLSGTEAFIAETGNLAPDNINSPNGLAFDVVNGRLYFGAYNDEDQATTYLYFYDVDSGLVEYAGEVEGITAGAGFGRGAYWYIKNKTDDLYKVTFDGDGKVADNPLVQADITGGDKFFRFGDLAISPCAGLLYGSSLGTSGGYPAFFSVELEEPYTYTEIKSSTDPWGLQLAYGSDGELYGHSTVPKDWYQVDTATGDFTLIRTGVRQYTDLAQGESVYNFVNTPALVCDDETAWAYGGDLAKPNNEVEGNPSNAWGWTNNITGVGNYTFDLYAGAAQNDLSKGFLAGNVTVSYNGTCVTVTYEVDDPYTLAEAHLWVGETELPLREQTRRGVTTYTPTAAPGQFSEYVDYDSVVMGDQSATFVVCDVGAPFWVAAHAVVEWCEYDSRAIDEILAALGNNG